jgi:hypothetical protein
VELPGTIDLVGPKGYVHGWIFKGVPTGGGKPVGSAGEMRSRASAQAVAGGFSEFADEHARVLKQGDQILASYHGGLAGFRPHSVMSVVHGRDGKSRMTVRDNQTGELHQQTVSSHSTVTMSRGVGMIKAQTAARKAAAAKGRATRASRLPRPPAGMDTPDMRLAIRAGLLSADNRLGARARQVQFASDRPAIELAKPTSAAGRRSLAGRNLALPDGSFPVPNADYWDKARQAIGRVADPAKRAAVAKLLRRTAPRFGKTAALKNSWAAPGGSKHSNTGQAMEFAMPTTRPIRTPSDLVIVRGEGGVAIIRHRQGGDEIGQIRREGRGWRASIGGKDLDPRNHQRTALADVIGTHNRGAATAEHRPATSAGSALQPPAQQTPLMAQYGIPAIRALATPSSGSDDGPRVTSNDPDDGKSSGLTPKGMQIKKKLLAKGWPDARADQFARRAQNMGKS